MPQALNSINSVESNTYSLNPDKRVDIKFIIINPDNTFDGIEYADRQSVLTELLNTEVGDELKDQYCENLDRKFDEDEFDEWAFNNFERVAEEMNYRIKDVERMK